MSAVPPPRPSESTWLYAFAGALMVGGPVWRYLFVNYYPFDRPEGIVLPLACGLAGAAIAVAGHKAGGLVEKLTFGGLLYVFIDLQFDLEKLVIELDLMPIRHPTILVIAGCLAVPAVVRARRAALICLMLGAFYLASLVRPSAGTAPRASGTVAGANRTKPMLVHVVLDEQWGIGGLRAAGDSGTAAFLEKFYLDRGFEVYDGAYSRWEWTRFSIPDVMSFGHPLSVQQFRPLTPFYRVRTNPYFEWLRSQGYAIHVFQNSYLDYCHSANVVVASCEEVPFTSIANIGYLRGSWLMRAVRAGRYLLNMTSHVYVRLHKDGNVWRRSFAGRGLAQIADAEQTVGTSAGEPTAIFVHVLLPHDPFEVDSSCTPYLHQVTDSSWRVRLTQYGAQTRCVHNVLGELLATLDSAVGRDGAAVIIHGDHGSRMHRNDPGKTELSHWDAQQLNASFSTLLAIRRPRVPAALHSEPVPVQDFFWELVRHDFTGEVHGAWRHYVRDPFATKKQTDTLRELRTGDMLWAHPAQPSPGGSAPPSHPR